VDVDIWIHAATATRLLWQQAAGSPTIFCFRSQTATAEVMPKRFNHRNSSVRE